jgi:protein-L-isoaspartate O-methyltransferase
VTDEAGRERLRRTFESAAARYQRARPEYPAALYDDLLAATALPPGERILEIGCATGKATLPLARRGFGVTCIELGPDLARAARANLATYDVSVVEGSFEWRTGSGSGCTRTSGRSWPSDRTARCGGTGAR